MLSPFLFAIYIDDIGNLCNPGRFCLRVGPSILAHRSQLFLVKYKHCDNAFC